MRMQALLSIPMVLLLSAPAAAGPEIPIGTVAVKLGADEKDVIPALKKEYALEEIRGGLYQVTDKKDTSKLHGIVEVREGKVTFASRDLGAFEGEGVRDFGHALYDAIHTARTGDTTEVRIETKTDKSNAYAVNIITLHFPDRKIEISLGRDKGAVDASMEEILSSQ